MNIDDITTYSNTNTINNIMCCGTLASETFEAVLDGLSSV